MNITPPAFYQPAYSIGPDSVTATDETADLSNATRDKRAFAITNKLWPQNKTLTIAFVDMPDQAKAFITKKIKDTYSGITNIKLDFVDGSAGDIRISGSKEIKGNWSTMGTDALKIPANEPTMHLDIYVPKSLLAMHALHEIGHTLGLDHEHQHPDRTLVFNTKKTYELYQKAFGWDYTTTYQQILKPADRSTIKHSDYDPKSIMQYNLHESVLWKQDTTGYNATLSTIDKTFLKSLYPPAPPESA